MKPPRSKEEIMTGADKVSTFTAMNAGNLSLLVELLCDIRDALLDRRIYYRVVPVKFKPIRPEDVKEDIGIPEYVEVEA